MNLLGGKTMFLAGLALGASGAGGYIYNDPFAMLNDAGYFGNINIVESKQVQGNREKNKADGETNKSANKNAIDANESGSRPRFEFYSILPELEIVTDKRLAKPTANAASKLALSAKAQKPEKPAPTDSTTATLAGPSIASGSRTPEQTQVNNKPQDLSPKLSAGEVFFLQAGSFQNSTDAERRKVDLLLMGLPVDIYPVIVGGNKRYRVHVGPFSDIHEKDDARGRLRANNVEFITLRAR